MRIRDRTPSQLGLIERFRQPLQNEVRLHWALAPARGGEALTPAEAWAHGRVVDLPKWKGWAKAAKEKPQNLLGSARFPLTSDTIVAQAVWRQAGVAQNRAGCVQVNLKPRQIQSEGSHQ